MVLGALVAVAAPRNEPVASRLPAWELQWQPPAGGIASHLPAQRAFALGVKAYHTADGTFHTPARTIWLASGPAFGLAVVRLDPAGQYSSVVNLDAGGDTGTWTANVTDLGDPGPCESSPSSAALAFLGSTCDDGIGGTPTYAMRLWTTPDGQQLLAERTNLSAQRPAAGAASITVEGLFGWSITAHGWTSIVLPLPHAATLIFAGTVDMPRLQALAFAAASHLDQVFSCTRAASPTTQIRCPSAPTPTR